MTETSEVAPVFLTADWRHLVMLNFEIDPALLAAFVPAGTELDEWNGTHYVSVVAFRFLNTRVKGIAVPFHRNFDEINLRFYVRHKGPEGWRRGVVFLKEVVPRWAIAAVARWIYNEKYVACPTSAYIAEPIGGGDGSYRYEWTPGGMESLKAIAEVRGEAQPLVDGTETQFITEHYWGYAKQRDGGTVEYRVEHAPWATWACAHAELSGPVGEFYGSKFASTLAVSPKSAFVAAGSAVVVREGRTIF